MAVALNMRERGATTNDLAQRLAGDERIPLAQEEIEEIIRRSHRLVGMAREQTDRFLQSVKALGPHGSHVRMHVCTRCIRSGKVKKVG